MIDLLHSVFLAADISYSTCWIYCVNSICFAKFLWRHLQLTIYVFPCKLGNCFVLLLLRLFLYHCILQIQLQHVSTLASIFLLLMGVLCVSWIWMFISFLILGTFSAIIFSNKFSAHSSVLSFFGNPIIRILVGVGHWSP